MNKNNLYNKSPSLFDGFVHFIVLYVDFVFYLVTRKFYTHFFLC